MTVLDTVVGVLNGVGRVISSIAVIVSSGLGLVTPQHPPSIYIPPEYNHAAPTSAPSPAHLPVVDTTPSPAPSANTTSSYWVKLVTGAYELITNSKPQTAPPTTTGGTTPNTTGSTSNTSGGSNNGNSSGTTTNNSNSTGSTTNNTNSTTNVNPTSVPCNNPYGC